MGDKIIPVRMDERLVNQLDALVERGLYSNRTEAIRSSVRTLIEEHGELHSELLIVSRIAKAVIQEEGGENISKVILYGSVAEGGAGEESDIDIFVVVKGGDPREWRMKFNELIYPMILEIGRQISLVVHTEEELRDLEDVGDPFVEEVLENGVPL